MHPPDREDLSNGSLVADVLTPLILASALFSLLTIALMTGTKSRSDYTSFLFPGALLLVSFVAFQFQRFGRLRQAGLIMATALALLPMLTSLLFGSDQNAMMFIAPIGVMIAMIIGSITAGATITVLGLLLLVASIFLHSNDSLIAPAILMLVMVATAAMGGWAADSIHGTIAWAIDTSTKSERREALLRQTQDELQQAIYERERLNTTLQQTNRDLEAARAAAEAAYQSKSSFMARMSHELRTPLNLVIGFSNAMLDHPEMYEGEVLSPLYQADVSAIRASGQHLLGLINDILELAKIEAGRLELHKAPFMLEPLLSEMSKTASALLMSRPVVFRGEWASPLPILDADETRVRQVLLNLISNASKFTDQGEITLGAQTCASEVRIWVRDTGIGIAPADQARVFGEFEQAEGNDSRKRGGTGLGLSICRWLIELHGGRMWLESEYGHGSTFFFTLPLAPANTPTADAPPVGVTNSASQ